MLIEHWIHLRSFLTGIKPLLTDNDKEICAMIIKYTWDHSTLNESTDETQSQLIFIMDWILHIRDYLPDHFDTNLGRSGLFISWIINRPHAGRLETIIGCGLFDYYWYSNTCNSDPDPALPPSPPSPPQPDDGIGSFLGLHTDLLIEYTANVGRDIAGQANYRIEYWNNVLGSLYAYSEIMAAQEQFVDYINYPLNLIRENFSAIDRQIGDMAKLDGRNIVDAILYVNDQTGDAEEKISKALLRFFEMQYSKNSDGVSMTIDGLMYNFYMMERQWRDLASP